MFAPKGRMRFRALLLGLSLLMVASQVYAQPRGRGSRGDAGLRTTQKIAKEINGSSFKLRRDAYHRRAPATSRLVRRLKRKESLVLKEEPGIELNLFATNKGVSARSLILTPRGIRVRETVVQKTIENWGAWRVQKSIETRRVTAEDLDRLGIQSLDDLDRLATERARD